MSTLSFCQLCDVPMLSKRLDLLFTIREFPANFEGFQPVGLPRYFQVVQYYDAFVNCSL